MEKETQKGYQRQEYLVSGEKQTIEQTLEQLARQICALQVECRMLRGKLLAK